MTEGSEKDDAASRDGRWLERVALKRRHVLLAAAAVVVLYLAGVTGKWCITPDSATYLTLGRSLAEGEGYRFNGRISTTGSPGLPAILAATHVLFGPTFWAPNLFIALCGIGAVGLTYLVIARLGDRPTALMVALASGLSYRFYLNAHEILTDMPFVLIFWAILYCVLRFQEGKVWWLVLAGVLSVVGMVVRIPGLLTIGVLAVAILFDRSRCTRKGRRLAATITLLGAPVATGLGMYAVAQAISPEMPGYVWGLLHVRTPIRFYLLELGRGFPLLLDVLSKILTGQEYGYVIGLVALVLMSVGIVWAWRNGRRLAAVIMLLLPPVMIAATSAAIMRPRNFLPVQALYLYAIFEGLCWTVRWVASRRRRPLRTYTLLKAAVVLTAFMLAWHGPKVLRWVAYYGYYSHTPHYYQKFRHGMYKEVHAVAETLRAHARPEDLIGVDRDRLAIFHFLSRKRMAPIPQDRRSSARDAWNLLGFIHSHSELRLVVLARGNAQRPFLSALDSDFQKLAERGSFRTLFAGEDYRVYERLLPGANHGPPPRRAD